ncbi:MAG: GtrA family protein [Alphaproteobacteria bacterium]|nr:GtrA family protein [Alphaproteobacteria bacterium]
MGDASEKPTDQPPARKVGGVAGPVDLAEGAGHDADSDIAGRPLGERARSTARHGAGFLIAGTLAFLTDAVILSLLNQGAGVDPFVARVFSVCCAMVVGFIGHRTLTFRVAGRPTIKEFAAYAGVAWSTVAVNYAIYSAVLLGWPGSSALFSLIVASIVAMSWSYCGMRVGVFGKPT